MRDWRNPKDYENLSDQLIAWGFLRLNKEYQELWKRELETWLPRIRKWHKVGWRGPCEWEKGFENAHFAMHRGSPEPEAKKADPSEKGFAIPCPGNQWKWGLPCLFNPDLEKPSDFRLFYPNHFPVYPAWKGICSIPLELVFNIDEPIRLQIKRTRKILKSLRPFGRKKKNLESVGNDRSQYLLQIAEGINKRASDKELRETFFNYDTASDKSMLLRDAKRSVKRMIERGYIALLKNS